MGGQPCGGDSLEATTPASLRAVQDQLSTLARSKGSPVAFVVDSQGRAVALYPAQPGLIGVDFSYRDWFKGAARTGGPYVSEAYRAAATGHPLVAAVAAPVLAGSRRVGYIVVLWQLDSVRAVSQGAHADDGITIIVTDQAGQPLTGTLSVDDRGQALHASAPEMTRQALQGHSVSLVRGGTLAAAGPVPGIGWTVTAELPSAVALAPARTFQRILATTLGVALLLVLVFTVLAWRAARRRTAEQSGAQYARSLIEAGLDPLLTISPEGKITDVNGATVRVTGIPREELVGTDFAGYFTEPQKANGGYRRVFAEGSVTDYPLTMRHLDGTLTEVLYNASVYRDVRGKVLGVFAAARDVTEQKHAQAELRARRSITALYGIT